MALKRQQAAEDAVAMSMRCISPSDQLPPGPVFLHQPAKLAANKARNSHRNRDDDDEDEDDDDDDDEDEDEDEDVEDENINQNSDGESSDQGKQQNG